MLPGIWLAGALITSLIGFVWLLLYGLLYLATALLFGVLYRRLRAWLRPGGIVR